MSAVEENGQRQEIIIVRRARHDEDEGHHGGVWKIAFADFMTAMMCFFLVMWLINAANEETRAALASYFNPVKLIDRNSSRKGLDELGGPQTIESTPENLKDSSESLNEPGSASQMPDGPPSEQKSEAAPGTDAHLFSDPYAVLAEIVADTGTLQNISSKGDGGAQESGPASGASGGESYRDPFAPDFWSQQVAPQSATISEEETEAEVLDIAKAIEQLKANDEPAEQPKEAAAERPDIKMAQEEQAEPLPDEPAEAVAQQETPEPGQVTVEAAAEADPAGKAETLTQAELAEALEAAEQAEKAQKAAEMEKAADAMREQLVDAIGDKGQLMEGVTVTATEDGILVSITDEINSGMFEIGSAVPRRELILAMEKIGGILGEQEGVVSINGHTDGRPFRSETYDNWRLSTARAHSAYYMLVRGGLAEGRIVEVAGFADRKLKVPEDPFADANRRIEILLELEG